MSRRNTTSLLIVSQTSSYDEALDSDYTEGSSVSSETTYNSQSRSTMSNPPIPEDSNSSTDTRIKSATQNLKRRAFTSSESSDISDSESVEFSGSSLSSLLGYNDSDYELPNLKGLKREVMNLGDIILTSESSEASQVSSHSSDIIVKYKENYSTSSDALTDYTSETESVTLTNQSQSDISESSSTSFEPSHNSIESSVAKSSVSSLTSLANSKSSALPSPSKRKTPISNTEISGRILRSGKKLLIKRQ